jgi:hypothetical protein
MKIKKTIIIPAILIGGLAMTGADFLPAKGKPVITRKHCAGYTIIEAGKGIDCYGDTVKLVKKYGYYELVRDEQTSVLQ